MCFLVCYLPSLPTLQYPIPFHYVQISVLIQGSVLFQRLILFIPAISGLIMATLSVYFRTDYVPCVGISEQIPDPCVVILRTDTHHLRGDFGIEACPLFESFATVFCQRANCSPV